MPRLAVRISGAALAPWAVLLASACGSSGTEQHADAAITGPPHLELGQGELAFDSLSDGEALPYVAGSQGGHHVFVSFRVENLDPLRMHVQVTTSVADRPELVLSREGRVNFSPTSAADAGMGQPEPGAVPASMYMFAGWPAQILRAPCHVGEAVLIEATLTDLGMQTASDARTIRIAKPDGSSTLDCPPEP